MTITAENSPLFEKAIAGRNCGSCTLCCKVFPVPWIDDKPAGAWCKHCTPGKGCGIWQTRPQGCKDFLCQYFFIKDIGEEWRPDRAKFLLNLEKGDTWLVVHADAKQPDAWKREPYGRTIRRWADYQMERGKGVMLYVGTKQFIVTPDSEVPIHEYPKTTKFQMSKGVRNGKVEYHVNILPPEDFTAQA
jgi:hypothetical protein